MNASWVLLLIPVAFMMIQGFAFLALGLGADPAHWNWLTSDMQVLNYLRMHFVTYGLGWLSFSFLLLTVSIFEYRRGEKWSWYAFWFIPVFLGVLAVVWFWAWPLFTLLLILSLLGLLIPYRKFFPKVPP